MLFRSSAVLVMFTNQVIQLQDVNRKIARLYERMDQVDRSQMLDTRPALEAQQRTILQRLQDLESKLREIDLEREASTRSIQGPTSLEAPPPPSTR